MIKQSKDFILTLGISSLCVWLSVWMSYDYSHTLWPIVIQYYEYINVLSTKALTMYNVRGFYMFPVWNGSRFVGIFHSVEH